MKRFLTLLLLLSLLFSFAACGDGGSAPDSSVGTDNTATEGTDTSPVKAGFDENAEHKFLACDTVNGSIVVFDLNACEGDYQLLTEDGISVVWEFSADEHPECTTLSNKWSISSAKYRYSAYYGRDVIIACASFGWAVVIDYEAEEVLLEANVAPGPHSIEMLPNGDLVVAASAAPGDLAYIPLSAGLKEPVSRMEGTYFHGVCWDPENEWLWVLDDTGVFAVGVRNMGTKDGELYRIAGTGDVFVGEGGGHALSPIYGEPGKYWASSASKLWVFDSETETLTTSFDRSSALTAEHNIKGICSFPDGTVVEAICNIGGNANNSWDCDGLRIFTKEMSKGKVQKLMNRTQEVIFDPEHRQFYKVQPFTKDYR